jgi:hypothetical protein
MKEAEDWIRNNIGLAIEDTRQARQAAAVGFRAGWLAALEELEERVNAMLTEPLSE